MLACWVSHKDAVKRMLVWLGKGISAEGFGCTPLHWSLRHGPCSKPRKGVEGALPSEHKPLEPGASD